MRKIVIEVPDELSPPDLELLNKFFIELVGKWDAAEKKHAWRSRWLDQLTQGDADQMLAEHLMKGDPRDVALITMLLWRFSWSTTPAAQLLVKQLLPDHVRTHRGGDAVNHPTHYNEHPAGVECIAIIEHLPHNIGAAIKYLWRAGLKGDALEDLRKAGWYCQREVGRVDRARQEKQA